MVFPDFRTSGSHHLPKAALPNPQSLSLDFILATEPKNTVGREGTIATEVAIYEAEKFGRNFDEQGRITVEINQEGLNEAIEWAKARGYTVYVDGILVYAP